MTSPENGRNVNDPSQGALSVTNALLVAKEQLESISIAILGEVSEISSRYEWGFFFTVKDKSSSLSCIIWKNRYEASGVEIRIGSLIRITGRFSVYQKKGQMNFQVFSIKNAGEGDLRLQIAQLAKRLQQEGLMAPEAKSPLPYLPSTIGLVTSPNGAAVHDVLRTLRRRYPLARILFAGVLVEGRDAPKNMVAALRTVADAGAEVILLVRGGGSFEDHLPFNDESLARAIRDIDVPIVTGIGHEPDNSISDMVADRRASTPTAAAEAVAPDISSIKGLLDKYSIRLNNCIQAKIDSCSLSVDKVSSLEIFQNPKRLFANEMQLLDEYGMRLNAAIPNSLNQCDMRLKLASSSLKRLMATAYEREDAELRYEASALLKIGSKITDPFRENVNLNASRLDDLSPLKVLSRGYAIAQDGDGNIIDDVDKAEISEDIRVIIQNGYLDCVVKGVEKKDMIA